MSRPLVEFGGGSGEIPRDLLHLRSVSEAEALISGAECRDQLRHSSMSLQPPEPRGSVADDAGGDSAQHHLAAPPALHVAFDVAGPAKGVQRGKHACMLAATIAVAASAGNVAHKGWRECVFGVSAQGPAPSR